MKNIDLSNMLINCPEKGFSLRCAKACFTCGFYNGIIRATSNGIPVEGNEPELFNISCKRPITRSLQKVILE